MNKKYILSTVFAILLFTTACEKQKNSPQKLVHPLSIMTYNIRLDLKSDGINQWDNRKLAVLSILQKKQPDVVGLQEALPHQISFLTQQLKGYGMIGQGRDGGNMGEYCAIFYNKKTIQLISSDTFWLSETPEIPSLGWDAAYKRICTNGLFTQKNTQKKIHIYNTHLDHIGEIAQLNSIQQITQHIRTNNSPENTVILMGDFNSLPTSKVIRYATQHLDDAFLTQNNFSEYTGTFNAFNTNEQPKNRIDYIFTKNTTVHSYKDINTKTTQGNWPSDHLPILVHTQP